LTAVGGAATNPAAGISTPTGSTTFGGNNDVAIVRVAR
jgi:hypothetical protein